MFYGLFLLVLVASAVVTHRLGARPALWACWPPALLLLPVWLAAGMGALLLDLRTAAAAGVLLGGVSAWLGKWPSRWLFSDVLVVVLTATQVVSEYKVGIFGTLTVPELIRSWALPYFLGRFFLGSASELQGALRPFCKAMVGLSAFAMFESVTKLHLVNKALGKVYGVLEQGEGYRMGLKRAQGMTDHPIFFGMMLVLFLPWAMTAAGLAKSGRDTPRWWKAVPWLMGGALFGTVSRGPQISALATVYVATFFARPKWRVAMALLAIVGGTAVYTGRELVMDQLQKAIAEEDEEPIYVNIDGEEELYTGTRHRVLLFKVYAEALANAGLFGYGLQMTGIDLEESLAQRFGSIDSTYVMFYLQRGYSGVVPFVLLELCTLVQLGGVAWKGRGPVAGLAGAMFGAMAAVDVGLFTSWFAPDFGTVWLFLAGFAANLATLPQPEDDPPPSSARARVIQRRRPSPRITPPQPRPRVGRKEPTGPSIEARP